MANRKTFRRFILASFCLMLIISAAPALADEPLPIQAHLVTIKAIREWVELEGVVLSCEEKDQAVVVLDANTEQAARILPGKAVNVFLPAPRSGQVKGSVKQVIGPDHGKQQGHKVRAIVVNPASALKPGQQVRASIKVQSSPKNPYVPWGCVMHRNERTYLFVVEEVDGKKVVLRKEVRVGVRTEEWAEIRDGLRPTQLVALPPLDKLSSGCRVKITKVLTDYRNPKRGEHGQEDR